MATTGTPNQKYVATDKPDLVSGKYSSHTHSFSLTKDDMPTVVENTENFSDNSQIVCASAAGDKPDYFRQAIKMWNYIKSKADAVYAALSHTHTISQITDFSENAAKVTFGSTFPNCTGELRYKGGVIEEFSVFGLKGYTVSEDTKFFGRMSVGLSIASTQSLPIGDLLSIRFPESHNNLRRYAKALICSGTNQSLIYVLNESNSSQPIYQQVYVKNPDELANSQSFYFTFV